MSPRGFWWSGYGPPAPVLAAYSCPLPSVLGLRRDGEKRSFSSGEAVLELPLKADYALIEVSVADTLGNAVYNATARNSAPVMAMAARVTIALAGRIVEPGQLDPEAIISPGIFVNRLVAAH